LAQLPQRKGPGRGTVLIGAGLAAFYFILLMSTLDIGIPRDEGFYFSAGEQYSRWFDDLLEDPAKAFQRETVDRRFANNPEHPAFPKILFGLSWRVFGRMLDPEEAPYSRHWYDAGQPPETRLGILSESTAMRLPALVVSSFLVFLVFLFGSKFFNRRVGLAAAAAWMFMPHGFWHAHLACFDMPVTAMWFLTGYCFLKAERGGWKWAVLTGVAFGLALSTKHNAYFIPPLFLVYFLMSRWRGFGVGRNEGDTGIRLPAIPLAFPAMLVVSPLVYYALWPNLWYEPFEHLKWYFGRHANHEYYWAYYFGTLYTRPPFPISFPFVMSAITIPVTTLALSGLGMAVVVRDRLSGMMGRIVERLPVQQPGAVLFVGLNLLVPFLVIAAPSVPIFGGTKHWMHGLPYLAIFAGLGFEAFYRILCAWCEKSPRFGHRALLAGLASAAFLALPAWSTLHGHTNGSTYFNVLAGGFGGMGEHGLQREFWGNTAYSALDYLNREAPVGARVDFHDTAWDAVRMYRRDGLIRKDIVPVWDYKRADFFLFHWHKEFLDLEAEVKDHFGVTVPAYVVAQDGVPLLNVYRRSTVVDRRRKALDVIRKMKRPDKGEGR